MNKKQGLSVLGLFVNDHIWHLALVSTLVKLFVMVYVQNSFGLYWINLDEQLNLNIAKSIISGDLHGASQAYHQQNTVFIYLLFVYFRLPLSVWFSVISILQLIAYLISVSCFFKLCTIVSNKEKVVLLSTALYILLPSSLYFIGSMPQYYESLTTYLLVIYIYMIISAVKNQKLIKLNTPQKFMILLIPLASILLRPQMIPIYYLLFIFQVLSVRFCTKNTLFRLTLTAVIVIPFFHIPSLFKNFSYTGKFFVSNQSGFELLQGHNPYARGSWMNGWGEIDSPLYRYVLDQIPDIETKSQYEESKLRKSLAFRWIALNPKKELILSLRKTAIYFYPNNFEVLPGSRIIDPILIIVFCGFFYSFLNIRNISITIGFLYIPIFCSFLISIVFFVGYRWRFYAEPFMILVFCWSMSNKPSNSLNS